MDEYTEEKLKRYAKEGLRECCGVPTEIHRPCASRLCPIEKEKIEATELTKEG